MCSVGRVSDLESRSIAFQSIADWLCKNNVWVKYRNSRFALAGPGECTYACAEWNTVCKRILRIDHLYTRAYHIYFRLHALRNNRNVQTSTLSSCNDVFIERNRPTGKHNETKSNLQHRGGGGGGGRVLNACPEFSTPFTVPVDERNDRRDEGRAAPKRTCFVGPTAPADSPASSSAVANIDPYNRDRIALAKAPYKVYPARHRVASNNTTTTTTRITMVWPSPRPLVSV